MWLDVTFYFKNKTFRGFPRNVKLLNKIYDTSKNRIVHVTVSSSVLSDSKPSFSIRATTRRSDDMIKTSVKTDENEKDNVNARWMAGEVNAALSRLIKRKIKRRVRNEPSAIVPISDVSQRGAAVGIPIRLVPLLDAAILKQHCRFLIRIFRFCYFFYLAIADGFIYFFLKYVCVIVLFFYFVLLHKYLLHLDNN